jgi:UPF0716 family protein affecting phage T7 exclusion
MRLVPFFAFAVLFSIFLWFAAEISVFLYVVDEIGFIGAILLLLATSYVGVRLLRRVGGAARQRLFDVLQRQQTGFSLLDIGLRDGAVAALAAILLIIPGFLSDVLGLVLAAASAGFWWHAPPAQRSDPGVLDLAPDEWHPLDATARIVKKP